MVQEDKKHEALPEKQIKKQKDWRAWLKWVEHLHSKYQASISVPST
jgi:hypothetical protein